MRFFLPDWDDFVDADYDFHHEYRSAVAPTDRQRAYIWDLFDQQSVPVDGVLFSKRQIESSSLLGASEPTNTLSELVPDWLSVICDSGAWGYQSLPFPPYDNSEMLSFYDDLDVSIGVTVDHLILGDGATERLYLDERALPESFSTDLLHETVRNRVDVMTAEWPAEWPAYVTRFADEIANASKIRDLDEATLAQPYSMLLPNMEEHPHAIFRHDDAAVRQELSVFNAQTARELYMDGDYSFRLMGVVQGRDASSYAHVTDQLLDAGFNYIGLGGIAGSSKENTNEIVCSVGNRIAAAERAHNTRIDTHLFGFAKSSEFETIGRSRVASYDSASPMRSAWTGGNNYHLPGTGDYDAIRVRYPEPSMTLQNAIERTLRGQELLCTLRAFDEGNSIKEHMDVWCQNTRTAIQELTSYLRGHKHDARYQHDRLDTLRSNFRSHYPHAAKLVRSFGLHFLKPLLKLIRRDSALTPIEFGRYQELIETASTTFEATIPDGTAPLKGEFEYTDTAGREVTMRVVENYAETVGDQNLLSSYRELLKDRPWEGCNCPICTELGIEVVVFRGANRNKRRGFHNTHQLYRTSQTELPSIAVLTRGTATFSRYETVEEFLKTERTEIWDAIHDLPIIEIGVFTADGVYEWWEPTPSAVSFEPDGITSELGKLARRFSDLYIDTKNWTISREMESELRDQDTHIRKAASAHVLRNGLLRRLGYEEEFLPDDPARVQLR